MLFLSWVLLVLFCILGVVLSERGVKGIGIFVFGDGLEFRLIVLVRVFVVFVLYFGEDLGVFRWVLLVVVNYGVVKFIVF